jgi:adenylyltransferase/sulfurtransferase
MKGALLVGAGGLGSPAAFVLARAGVSRIAVADDDRVEASNLHRQLLHRSKDVGRGKAESAGGAIRRLAPSATVIAHAVRVEASNVLDLVRGYDVVIDGSDSFATKFLINDACVLAGIPFVHAAAIRWGGQWLAVRPGEPCYRCLFEEMPPAAAGASCAEAGIVGPVAGVVGALAAEAAMVLLAGRSLASDGANALTVYDGRAGTFRVVRFRKNPSCRACGSTKIAAIDPRAYEGADCAAN